MLKNKTYRLVIALLWALLANHQIGVSQNYAISAEQVDSLVKVVANQPDDSAKAWNLTRICSNHPNVDSTLKYAQELFSLSFKVGPKWKAIAYRYMGWYCQITDDPNGSLDFYFKSLKINDSLKIPIETALNYNAIGENFETLNDFNSANIYFHKAMDLLMSNNSPLVSYSYRNLGILYLNFKIFDACIRYFNDALKIDTENDMTIQVMLDHYYMSLTQLALFEDKHDAKSLSLAKKHSNIAQKMADDLELDFYIIHTSICSVQTMLELAKLADEFNRQKILDSCQTLMNSTIQKAKDNGYYESLQFDFGMCDFLNKHISKQYNECLAILDSISRLTENNPIFNRVRPDVYACYREYYISVNDYKNALAYTEKYNKAKKQNYDPSFNVSSIKSDAKAEFEMEMRQHKLNEQKKEIIFKEHRIHMRIIIGVILLSLLILTCMATSIIKDSRHHHNMNLVLMKKKEEMKAQRDLIANANYEATSSIRYAKQIQTAIIPTPDIMKSIFGDCLIYWKPLEIVSGDFYWAAQIDRLKIIAVADCTGHGIPGAFMSMLGITSLNDIVSTYDIEDITASEILDKLRTKINNALHQSEDNGMSLDGMEIALGIIDTENMKIQYAGAYIPMIIIHNGLINMYFADKMPIGYQPKNTHAFTNNNINLQNGDVIYFYTDGIANQFSSEEHGNKFTTGRLNNIILTHFDKPFNEQKQIIAEALTKWRTSSLGNICQQTDDQLIIGIKI